MNDHSAPRPTCAPGEPVRYDRGGWISGPSADVIEPIAARDLQPDDVLMLDDGTRATVTDTQHSLYWFPEGRAPGIAIGWRAGSSSGLLFRRGSDLLERVAPCIPGRFTSFR